LSDLKVLSTDEMAHIPRPKWLIEDFVAEKSTTMIYGPWGLGKSFMTLDMVLTATTGGEWYGRKVERPLKTLFIVAEGAAWWYRRLLAYERERGPVDREMMLWIAQPVNLWNSASEMHQLEEILTEHQPDVMVIDTWVRCSSAFGMNEDKATDTAMVYNKIDYLRDKYHVAPVLVHHPTKSGGARGSGNQEASVERVISLLEVKESKTMFDVVDEKGNHTEPFPTFRMRFENVDMGDLSEGLTSAVVRHEGLVSKTKRGEGQSNADLVFNAIRGMLPMTVANVKTMELIPAGSVYAALSSLVAGGLLINNDGEYELP
jgi:hypothetical protein